LRALSFRHGHDVSLKIALVTRRYPPLIGGAEKVLSYLAPALAAEGALVTVVTAQVPASAQPPPAREQPVRGLCVVRLPTAQTRIIGTWRYMQNLAAWFAANPVDLAYVSMLKHDAYVAVGQGQRLGFPVALRPEGAGKTGDLAWQRWGRFGRTIGKRCKKADALVAISPAIRAELETEGYDPARIINLPNGVPVLPEPWRPRVGWRDAPRAVYVGRLAPEKGLDTLVEAWPTLIATHPAATLTLVGEGPERAKLQAQVEQLGLGQSVRLAGASADPIPLLRSADLFVLPSREEGMSIALLESMALGVPAVATAIPGNLGLLTDGLHGRLATPGNPEALALAMLDQWSNPERALAMAAQARSRVEAEFAITAVARRHLELFERLVRARAEAKSWRPARSAPC